MKDAPPRASLPLPAHPNLRHLKDQAKDLLCAGGAASLSEAQFAIARWERPEELVESSPLG